MAVLEADGYVDRLGRDRFHDNVHRAVGAELGDTPSPLAADAEPD